MSDAKRYWVPGPLTNYGTTANGFAGEVLVVAAVDYGELERDLRDATIEADRVHKEHAEMIDGYEAKLEEYERRIDELQDEVDSSNQLIDKSARLAKACAYLREVGDDYPGSSCQQWCHEKAAECESDSAPTCKVLGKDCAAKEGLQGEWHCPVCNHSWFQET